MKTFLRLLGFLCFACLILCLINLLADGNLDVTKWLYEIGAGLMLVVIVWPEPKSNAHEKTPLSPLPERR